MQGPFLLPSHLTSYEECATDSELFQALISKIEDLFLFFESACEDERWVLQHSKFMRLVLRWATKQFYLGNLSLYYARRLVAKIQHHYSLLRPFLFFRAALFFTVRIRVEHQDVLVNSLLFGVGSPILGNIFKRECFEKLNDEWILHHVKLSTFQLIDIFLAEGKSPELWKYEYEEILALMTQAKAWELQGLVQECASFLRRYIDEQHVVEIILNAHQQGFEEWKKVAYDFFNQQRGGLKLLWGDPADLKIEILNFQPENLELFQLFAPWITHVAFRGSLSEGFHYLAIIHGCPDLIGVDISESVGYANQFAFLPPHLLDLALSSCGWLLPDHLRQAAAQCPSLKKLELANNRHLNYLAWGELYRFKWLKTLKLDYCIQLTNEDLKIIGRGCPLLSDLSIESCRKIDDKGIADLVILCPYLQDLNVNDCDQFTDQALIIIGLHLPQLVSLKLVRCEGLTDYGLLQLVKLRSTLASLHVQGCHFSLKTLDFIQKTFPLLDIRD